MRQFIAINRSFRGQFELTLYYQLSQIHNQHYNPRHTLNKIETPRYSQLSTIRRRPLRSALVAYKVSNVYSCRLTYAHFPPPFKKYFLSSDVNMGMGVWRLGEKRSERKIQGWFHPTISLQPSLHIKLNREETQGNML